MKKILKKNPSLPLLAFLGILFAILTLILRSKPKPSMPCKAVENPYMQSIYGVGMIEPKSEVIAISADLPGIVQHVYGKVGQDIKEGEILFEMDQREIDAHISQVQADLEMAQLSAQEAHINFENVNRQEAKRVLTKDEFNRRKFAKDIADAKVKKLEAELKVAKINKERLKVKAPITGQILESTVHVGEYAPAGGKTLMQMGDTKSLHVRVEFDEDQASFIDASKKALAILRTEKKEKIPLSFIRIEPFIKPKHHLSSGQSQRVDTRVLQVLYALPKDLPLPLWVGLQLDVFINNESVNKN